MLRLSVICAALIALIGALLGSGTAAATPPRPVDGPFPPNAFEVEGSNGYSISVASFLDPRTGRGTVSLVARRGHEFAAYTAPAKVSEDSIRADFGELGRVDLVLRRTGAVKETDFGCLGHREAYEAGTYEGTFEFDGEGGFTRARATQVVALPGLAVVPRGELCDGGSSGESRGPNLPGARLGGISYANGRILKFQFDKNRPGAKTHFVASLAERHEGVRIFREASGVSASNSFRYSDALRTASLGPPSPFSGTASLTRDRDSISPSIAGDLTLSFPGRSIALAGPAIHVSLVHARLEKGDHGSITVGLPHLLKHPGV